MKNILPPARKKYDPSGLNPQALKIVQNVLQHCKAEKFENKLLVGNGMISAYKERTAYCTGVPWPVIETLDQKKPSPVPELSFSLQLAIRNILKRFYSLGSLPKSKLIFEMLKVKNDCVIPYAEFLDQLSELGYENVKTVTLLEPTGNMIMENPKVTFERFFYIKRIKKARNMDQKIYFLDLRSYDKEQKCMVPLKGEDSQSNFLVLYYITSKDGYASGLFNNNFDQVNFTNWVLNVLMAVLQPSSLIVIKNNPLLENFEHSSITRYHPKKEMLQWLKNQDVPCNPTMNKAELFELIEKCPIKVQNNNIENILKSKGHDVIRIPDHIQNMTPSELLWKDVNEKLELIDLTKEPIESLTYATLIKNSIAEIISSISENTWNKYYQVILQAEEDFFVLDNEIENYLEKYEIDFKSLVCDGNKKWNRMMLSAN